MIEVCCCQCALIHCTKRLPKKCKCGGRQFVMVQEGNKYEVMIRKRVAKRKVSLREKVQDSTRRDVKK